MTLEERALLESAAKKATPGPWLVGKKAVGRRHVSAAGLCIAKVYRRQPDDNKRKDQPFEGYFNAEYIALADPTTILSLLDDLRRAEERIKALEMVGIIPSTAPDITGCTCYGYLRGSLTGGHYCKVHGQVM